MEEYERSGRLKEATTDENVAVLHNLIVCDRRKMLRDIDLQIGISFSSVQSSWTDIVAKWIPRMLNKDQRKNRIDNSEHPKA